MHDMLPRLHSDFVTTGDLRVQLVIVPLKKYPNSMLESSALLCATAMEKGQAMHDAIRTAKLRDRKSLITLAKKIALQTAQFTKCLDAKETKNLLADQQAFINDHAVTLIPTFMLGGSTPLTTGEETRVGLPSYPDLRGWIRERLAR